MPHRRASDAGFTVTAEITDEFLESLWLLEEMGKGKKNKKQVISDFVVEEGHLDSLSKAEAVIAYMVSAGRPSARWRRGIFQRDRA